MPAGWLDGHDRARSGLRRLQQRLSASDGSIRAYAYAGFLIASSQQPAANNPSTQPADFTVGDTATTEGTTNVRNGASVSGSLLGTFKGGDIVEITDGPFYDRDGEPWYYIVGDSVQGFVMGDFLLAATVPRTTRPIRAAAQPDRSSTPRGLHISRRGTAAHRWVLCLQRGVGPACAQRSRPAAPSYTPIMAADGGTIVEAGWCDCGLGYYVKIDHGNGLASLYGHMAEMPYVRVGQTVDQGDTIGPVGSTGLSTGPHIPWRFRRTG